MSVLLLRVFNATFNNISVISWRSILFVWENRGTRKKTTNLPVVTYKSLSNDRVYGLFVSNAFFKSTWMSLLLLRVFDATFYNISVISWRSIILMMENRVNAESNRPTGSHWQNSLKWVSMAYMYLVPLLQIV